MRHLRGANALTQIDREKVHVALRRMDDEIVRSLLDDAYDSHADGMKIPERLKRDVETRIQRCAEEHYHGKYTHLDVRFRGQFCYIDAYTEPSVPENWPPTGISETREEYIEPPLAPGSSFGRGEKERQVAEMTNNAYDLFSGIPLEPGALRSRAWWRGHITWDSDNKDRKGEFDCRFFKASIYTVTICRKLSHPPDVWPAPALSR